MDLHSTAAVKYTTGGQQVNDGKPITVASAETVIPIMLDYENADFYYKRQGYVLVGFAATDGSRTPAEHLEVTAPGRRNAASLYAIWTEGSYALIYDANGGTGAHEAQTEKAAVTSVTFNIQYSSQMKPHDGAPDARFLGWAKDSKSKTPDFPYDAQTGTFTPAQITLYEADPVQILYAVWEYHYVLTFERGYADETSPLPGALDAWSVEDTYTFSIPEGPDPTRDQYEFMFFWSDTMERQNSENRYYKSSMGEEFVTTITLESDDTHRFVYPRFSPLGKSVLTYNANGGSNDSVPADYEVDQTSSWNILVPVNTATTPTRTGYTFIGWSTEETTTEGIKNGTAPNHTWLNDGDPAHKLYGGRTGNAMYTMNTDESTLHTLYAVWAPSHTLKVEVVSPYGNGWYQITYDADDCATKTDWQWDNSTNVSNNGKYDTVSLTYDQYDTETTYTFEKLFNVSNTKSNRNSSYLLHALTREGYVFRGYSFTQGAANPEFTVKNGGITERAGVTIGAGTEQGYRSGATMVLNNVEVDISGFELDPYERKTYTTYLYAVWSPDSDFYRVVMINPDTGAAQEVMGTTSAKIQADGTSSITIAANTLVSPINKPGYIYDYAETPNATTAKYQVQSVWTGGGTGTEGGGGKVSTRYDDTINWVIGESITIASDNPYLTYTTTDEGAYVYTYTLYPVESKGEIFRVMLDHTNSAASKLYRVVWTNSNQTSRQDQTFNTDYLQVTVRAGTRSYKWAANTLGWFWGFRDSDYYNFMGYSYTGSREPWNVDYTITETSIGMKHQLTTRYQYYSRINEALEINLDNPRYVTESVYNDEIPVHTVTLYPVWRPKKTFRVDFDPNGGNFSHLESGDDDDNDVNLIVEGQPYTKTFYEFATGRNVYAPAYAGHKLLGYSYTKQDPVSRVEDAVIDIPITTNSSNTKQFQTQVALRVDEADEGSGTKNVTVTKSGAPRKITLTVYAVWQKQQEFAVCFDHNGGTSSGNASTTPSVLRGAAETYAEITTKGGSATYSGYVLLGYSYNKVEPGLGQMSDVVYAPDADGYYGPIRVDKGTNPAINTVTSTTSAGVDYTVMTVYAVWASNATYYKLKIVDESGNTLNTITKTVSGATPENGTTLSGSYSQLTSIENKNYGYRLSGLSFEPGGETAYSVTYGKLDQAIPIAPDGRNVVLTENNNLKTYTLTLYAQWEQQNYFKVRLASNGGYVMNLSGAMSKDNPAAIDEYTVKADLDVTSVVVPSVAFETYSSSSSTTLFSRDQHWYAGFAYRADAIKGDYSVSQVTSSRPYRQRITNIVIDLEDPDMHIEETVDANGIKTYTLTLYAAWEPYQYFELEFLPNGGAFHNSSTGNAIDSHVTRSGAQRQSVSTYTFANVTYTDYNESSGIRPGYHLMGYSYTADGKVDVSITESGKKVEVKNISVSMGDTGKTVSRYTVTGADGGTLNVTKLSLYAVWGTRLDYSSAGGTTNMPTSVIRYEPEATDNRSFVIPQIRPVNKSFIFLGWSTRSGGTAQYGAEGYYEPLSNEALSGEIVFDANTGHVTLYAVWSQRYELFYHANGGNESSVPENETSYITSNQAAFDVSKKIPTRDPDADGTQYIFLGWADTADATVPRYSAQDTALLNYIPITGSTDGSVTPKHGYAVWQVVAPSQEKAVFAAPPAPSAPSAPPAPQATEPAQTSQVTETTPPTEPPATEKPTEPPVAQVSVEPPDAEKPAEPEPTGTTETVEGGGTE